MQTEGVTSDFRSAIVPSDGLKTTPGCTRTEHSLFHP